MFASSRPAEDNRLVTEPQASDRSVEHGCAPTPDQEEGPYYRELVLSRDDVTEGRSGSPLELAVQVLDARCMPVADVLVDIWHCDALGVYSWYAAVEEHGEIGSALLAPGTFLRGSQRTGPDGSCQFRTIYPGWYPGRAVHIHAKAHHAGSVLTVQLYFPEDVTDAVHGHPPYASRPRRDTTIDSDTIFPEGGSSTLLSPVSQGRGHRAEATLVVD
jgi:protocatechuate 3,4-dioxygenase beta subunit